MVLNCYRWAIVHRETGFRYLSVDKGLKKKVDFEFEKTNNKNLIIHNSSYSHGSSQTKITHTIP